jgi:DNA-binding SARP family transcriptional activator
VPGYCLEIAPDRVDALRFERDVRDGRQALDDGEHERAGVILRAVLATWRGSALGGTAGDWAEIEAARLEELRLQALELRVAADFAAAVAPIRCPS